MICFTFYVVVAALLVLIVPRSTGWRFHSAPQSRLTKRTTFTHKSRSNKRNTAIYMVKPNWYDKVDPDIEVISYGLDSLDHQPIEEPEELIERAEELAELAESTGNQALLKQSVLTKGYKTIMTSKESQSRSVVNSFYDSLLDPNNPEDTANYSIGSMTLEDISQAYHFSMAYLGDFVCALGIPPPIATDKKLLSFMRAEDVVTLLEAVTTLDPHDVNQAYIDNTASVMEIAEEFELSVGEVVKLCEVDCAIPLPFGPSTVLHSIQTELLLKQLNQYLRRKQGVSDEEFQPTRFTSMEKDQVQGVLGNDLDVDDVMQ